MSDLPLCAPVDKYTLGWPRFAATQVDRHNGGMVRRFSYLTARLLLYGQGRLHNLQQQLEEYENGPTYNPLGLSARQTRNVGEECPPDRLDLIMEEVRVELHQYCECLTLHIFSVHLYGWLSGLI
jgi:hypothetical protein